MDIELRTRGECYICGWATETMLENNNADISALYSSFFGTNKEWALTRLPLCKPGYYGLEWYTEGHKSFYYLLGKEVGSRCTAPDGAMLKCLPAAEYAVAHIPAGANLIDAWTEFFYTAIPAAWYEPDADHGYYFEYYPDGIHGECELWTPVQRSRAYL